MARVEDRLNTFPHIMVRQVNDAPEPYIPGTGLAVWEVVWLWRGYSGDMRAVMDHVHHLPITPDLVDEALAYARAYPDDIDPVVDDVETMSEERLRERFPGLRVVTFDPNPTDQTHA